MAILQILISLFCLGFLVWVSNYFSKRFKLPVVILALVFGILFKSVLNYFGVAELYFDYFLILGLIAFIILVFDGFVRLKLRDVDTVGVHSFGFVVLFASLIFVGFSLVLYFLLDWSPLSSVVFAASILGVSSSVVFLPKVSSYLSAIVSLESYWTGPVALLLPLIFVIFAPPLPLIFVSDLANFVFFAGIKFIASVSAGVFVGVILLKVLHVTNKDLVPPLVFGSVFVAFGLAYVLGGYGVFAVAALGFFFANVFVSFNSHFGDFNALFSKYSGLLCVVLLGFVSNFYPSWKFLLISFLLFLFYLIVRYFVIFICHKKQILSVKDRSFLVLFAPNGFNAAGILLFLSLFPPLSVSFIELSKVVNLGLMFILYSNFTAFVFSKWKK